MPTFPGQAIDYAKISPSGGVPAVEARMPALDGLTSIGSALQKVGQQVQTANDAMELSSLRRRDEEIENARLTKLQTIDPEDDDAIAQLTADAKAAKDANRSKRQEVNDALQIHRDSVEPSHDSRFAGAVIQRKAKNAVDKYNLNAPLLLEAGNMPEYLKMIHNAQATNVITKAEADYARKWSTVDSLMAMTRVRADKEPESAIKVLDDLSSKFQLDERHLKEKDAIIAHAMGIANRQRVVNKAKQDDDEWTLYKKATDGVLRREELDTSTLDAADKEKVWNRFEQAQREKRSTGTSVIEEGDPIMNARLEAIVDLSPEKLEPKDIWKAVDQGVGTKVASRLVTRLKTNQKQENATNQKYISEFSRLERAGIFGSPKKVQTAETAIKLRRKLDTFLATNPSEAEADKFFSDLIRKDVRTFGVLWSDNALPGFGDNPMDVTVKDSTGADRTFKIEFGEVIEVDGEFYQATGRKEGIVQWRKVKPR